MKASSLIIIFNLLLCSFVEAISVMPTQQGRRLGVKIEKIAYPQKLLAELKSGFTNRLIVEIQIQVENKVVGKKQIQLVSKYDLWEETFTLFLVSDGIVLKKQTYTKIAEVIKSLDPLIATDVMAIPSSINSGQSFFLRVELSLNPIEKEKMQEVQKWVRENSTAAASGFSGIISRPVSGKMFADLFSQVAQGQDNAATWRVSAESAPMLWKDLRESKE